MGGFAPRRVQTQGPPNGSRPMGGYAPIRVQSHAPPNHGPRGEERICPNCFPVHDGNHPTPCESGNGSHPTPCERGNGNRPTPCERKDVCNDSIRRRLHDVLGGAHFLQEVFQSCRVLFPFLQEDRGQGVGVLVGMVGSFHRQERRRRRRKERRE